jgi:hypothetical protein
MLIYFIEKTIKINAFSEDLTSSTTSYYIQYMKIEEGRRIRST